MLKMLAAALLAALLIPFMAQADFDGSSRAALRATPGECAVSGSCEQTAMSTRPDASPRASTTPPSTTETH